MELAKFLLLPATAYLVGSFPSAYIWTKLLRRVDIHEVGTGNSGASNVSRSVGNLSGLVVLFFDCVIKGFLPTFLFVWLELPIWSLLLSSLSLVAGHNWSVFLRFKGGRGVATSIGVVLGVGMWWQMLIMAIGPGLIGRGLIYKDSAPWTMASLLMLITLALIYESQIYITWLLIGGAKVQIPGEDCSCGRCISISHHHSPIPIGGAYPGKIVCHKFKKAVLGFKPFYGQILR